MKNIIKKIDDAVASSSTDEKTKQLLLELKEDLIRANNQNKAIQIVAIIIKVITGLFDD